MFQVTFSYLFRCYGPSRRIGSWRVSGQSSRESLAR